jgi:uncharacterized protein with FMN-binding domain
MKKFLLSFAVISIFTGYALYLHINTPAAATSSSTQTVASSGPSAPLKDGTYTGSAADAYYGSVQILAIVKNGKLSDVQFLSYPSDRSRSLQISQQAMPLLKSEAIAAQSANVQIVSGATDISQAFQQSLQSALSQAV